MIESTVRVSVVITCYNLGEYLEEAIDSVLSQSFKQYEIIVVDDGSTDETTLQILNKLNKPNTTIIRTDNHGLSSARNTGINKSRGKYILPLDADDKIHPDYLREAVEVIDNDPKIGIVTCVAEKFGEEKGIMKQPRFSIEEMLCRNLIYATSMFRKADFIRVGGYRPEMDFCYEDWDFWLSILEIDKKVFRIPKVRFYYRIRGDSMIHKSMNSRKDMERMHHNIFWGHLDLYKKYFKNPISIKADCQRELKQLNFKMQKVKKSREYRFGKLLLSPLRRIAKAVPKQ